MDERFPIYFNDVALARWLADRGSELWMTPDAAVYHDHGASTRLMGSAHTRQYLGAQVRLPANDGAGVPGGVIPDRHRWRVSRPRRPATFRRDVLS